MTELHYLGTQHNITGWGILILSMHMTSPLLWGVLVFGAISSFLISYNCWKEIKKEANLSKTKENQNELL